MQEPPRALRSRTGGSAVTIVAMPTASSSTARTAGRAWERAARFGYAVSGVLHLLIGATIVQIGLGSSGEADQQGALGQMASTPFGTAVLWLAVVAFVALGAWQAADAIAAPGGEETTDRLKSAGRAVLYLALAFTAASIALGAAGSSGDEGAQGLAAGLMEAPGGRVLVGAVGLGIVGGGVYHVVKGARKKFLEDLSGTPAGGLGRGATRLGVVGYVAKGVALVVVGVLFVLAAASADPEKAEGLDGAVKTLLDAPGGPVLVVLVGLGFAAYGLYSFVRARYARM